MTATAISAQATLPRSFVPPGDRAARLSHLDPRPLWREPPPVISPWRSPSFYLACALVMPAAAVIAPVRYMLGR